jgi:hypothetical protein
LIDDCCFQERNKPKVPVIQPEVPFLFGSTTETNFGEDKMDDDNEEKPEIEASKESNVVNKMVLPDIMLPEKLRSCNTDDDCKT